jgi:hypothetical protein
MNALTAAGDHIGKDQHAVGTSGCFTVLLLPVESIDDRPSGDNFAIYR